MLIFNPAMAALVAAAFRAFSDLTEKDALKKPGENRKSMFQVYLADRGVHGKDQSLGCSSLHLQAPLQQSFEILSL